MNLLIITCSNRANNISYLMGMNLLRKIRKLSKNTEVEILQLADVKLRGCCGTSACAKSDVVRCMYGDEDDFYKVYDKIVACDCVLFVVPKYAPYPSKFVQLYERIVSMAWGGYIGKGKGKEFDLYQKPVGLICFAGTEDTPADVFKSLRMSFCENGFRMLDFDDDMPGLFINRAVHNEDNMLEKVAEKVAKVLAE